MISPQKTTRQLWIANKNISEFVHNADGSKWEEKVVNAAE